MGQSYSVHSATIGLRDALTQYLEAQYHIWNEGLIRERKRLLDEPGTIFQKPWIEGSPYYTAAKSYSDLELPKDVADFFESLVPLNVGVFPKPYNHQAEALQQTINHDQDIIVATGTGSGKTESFLLPILAQLVREARVSPSSAGMPGCRALLLYPMNALVNDQLGRLRRLLGNEQVASKLKLSRNRMVQFGIYTSRTPYPGPRSTDGDTDKLAPLIRQLFKVPAEKRTELISEGKWPSKDMEQFEVTGFNTSPGDRELYTRDEFQVACPDLVVTNYSMLEYMLLRPIEANIFDQTRNWLHNDSKNQLIVVLDEAHMYRGAAGAEVAMLLRRLQSRLDVDRTKLKFILTSASLGSGNDVAEKLKRFAGDLTGLPQNSRPFKLITGTIEAPRDLGAPSTPEIDALANINLSAITDIAVNFPAAATEVMNFAVRLKLSYAFKGSDEREFRNAVFEILERLPSGNLLTKCVTGTAIPYDELASAVFQSAANGDQALERLMALCCIAKRASDGRVYLPLRLHLMFRGLGGIFACINPRCPDRLVENDGLVLGRLFDSPQIRCGCGSRVFELLTHRDCGTAYIRGYLRSDTGDFLWHEPTRLFSPEVVPLRETHFMAETARQNVSGGALVWLHMSTGRILRTRPTAHKEEYVELIQGATTRTDRGSPIITFDRCPACEKRFREDIKIMDFVTKGEAPFAHLIKTQVIQQPPTKSASAAFPNGGRKSLLFSDGRQKAARLARDIPREVERDTFRQVLLLAIEELRQIGWGDRARPDSIIYTAVVHVLAKHHLHLFDGAARQQLSEHVHQYSARYGSDLQVALDEHAFQQPSQQYKAHLLRQLCHSSYSIYSLTVGYVEPVNQVYDRLVSKWGSITRQQLAELAVNWIQRFLRQAALDDVSSGTREEAVGFRQRSTWGENGNFSPRQRKIITDAGLNAQELEGHFRELMTITVNRALFLDPTRVVVRQSLHDDWIQCTRCSNSAKFGLLGRCPKCGSNEIKSINPDSSHYLRARKTFWRDPIVRVLNGQAFPFALTVEEHTAQLSHRDTEKLSSTTEEFERRFRDILVHPSDTPVDVLSSTTTMEVGIDIGALVAVGLRNIPPMRQNYQQRAGRTGRRGSAVSTVVTYAQNNPHDSFYFREPKKILAGEVVLPAIDINNPRIVRRHVHAVLLQTFFHGSRAGQATSNDIFSALGDTWSFYSSTGPFTLAAFDTWVRATTTKAIHDSVNKWIPNGAQLESQAVSRDFIGLLNSLRPQSSGHLKDGEKTLIDFLFAKGLLPSYAFPRDLCAFQIEGANVKSDRGEKVNVVERTQQGLAVALGEYAPGRLVVVNKETYRIGTVAASLPSNVIDRAQPLFEALKHYQRCSDCSYIVPAAADTPLPEHCPICDGDGMRSIRVIQPEVVFADGGEPVNELDDDETRTVVTSTQMPVIENARAIQWTKVYVNGEVASADNQPLVILNNGEQTEDGGTGFAVCNKCGKAVLPGEEPQGAHFRDYHISHYPGQQFPAQCTGRFTTAALGYSFSSDVMLMRIPLKAPLLSDISHFWVRRPLEDALRSLSTAIAMSASHLLDVDVREMNAGYRFVVIGGITYAEIFVHDALAGGAGYASQTAHKIESVMDDTHNLLSNCKCQGSCDKCLRHYGNRMFHNDLDRFLALEMLAYIRKGTVPAVKSIAEQTAVLGPLRSMLELEGWACGVSASSALDAKKDGKAVNIAALPALLELPKSAPKSSKLQISEYELARDLPSAFSRVGT